MKEWRFICTTSDMARGWIPEYNTLLPDQRGILGIEQLTMFCFIQLRNVLVVETSCLSGNSALWAIYTQEFASCHTCCMMKLCMKASYMMYIYRALIVLLSINMHCGYWPGVSYRPMGDFKVNRACCSCFKFAIGYVTKHLTKPYCLPIVSKHLILFVQSRAAQLHKPVDQMAYIILYSSLVIAKTTLDRSRMISMADWAALTAQGHAYGLGNITVHVENSTVHTRWWAHLDKKRKTGKH